MNVYAWLGVIYLASLTVIAALITYQYLLTDRRQRLHAEAAQLRARAAILQAQRDQLAAAVQRERDAAVLDAYELELMGIQP